MAKRMRNKLFLLLARDIKICQLVLSSVQVLLKSHRCSDILPLSESLLPLIHPDFKTTRVVIIAMFLTSGFISIDI